MGALLNVEAAVQSNRSLHNYFIAYCIRILCSLQCSKWHTFSGGIVYLYTCETWIYAQDLPTGDGRQRIVFTIFLLDWLLNR